MKKTLLLSAGLLALTATSALTAQAEVTLADAIGDNKLYGYLYHDETMSKSASFNLLNADGTVETLWAETMLDDEPAISMPMAWINCGMLCGFGNMVTGNYINGFGYIVRNPVNGQVYVKDVEPFWNLGGNTNLQLNSAFFDSADNAIYGFGSYGRTMAYKKVPGNGDFRNQEVVAELGNPFNWCPAVCVDPESGRKYGITLGSGASQLVEIDAEGNSQALFTLPVKQTASCCGLVYIPETGYFVWSNNNGTTSALYAINLEAQTVDKVATLNVEDRYTSLIVYNNVLGQGVPAMPELLSLAFEGASTSGTATFQLPNKTIIDEELPAEISWVATVDGEQYAQGRAASGDQIEVVYEALASGDHTFGLYVENDGLKSGEATTSAYIGYDTPCAPANLLIDLSGDLYSAEWDAVTAGIHGGYIELDSMKYEVYLNGVYQATTADNVWETTMDLNQPINAYILTVYAVDCGLKSAGTKSAPVTFGSPLSLPQTFVPTEEQAAIFTMINNADSRWYYEADSWFGSVFHCGSTFWPDDDNDTWLITPPINFPDADAEYTISYETSLSYEEYEETYEIMLGKAATAEAMTEELLPNSPVPGNEDELTESSHKFKVPEAGVWYIGFHGTTPVDDSVGWNLCKITVGATSGVATITLSDWRVAGAEGAIVYTGAAGKSLAVYALDGRMVASATTGARTEISVDKGIYVVNVNGRSTKVVVR